MNQIPELQQLLSEVEKTFGESVNTSKDFARLSISISQKVKDTLGATTLKRLWGYISHVTIPRISSLDILAKYVGYDNFKDFKSKIHAKDSSVYLGGEHIILSDELSVGDSILIGWAPDRLVKLECLGEDRFKVVESANSKLVSGDEIKASSFCIGWPLFVSGILRDGNMTQPYVAGKSNGLTLLRKVQ